MKNHGLWVVRASAVLTTLIVGCTFFTDTCACTRVPPSKFVAGTVRDAQGTPVANAFLLFQVRPPEMSAVSFPTSPTQFDTQAGADGSFVGEVYRQTSDPAMLHVGVYRTASSPPIHVPAGQISGFKEGVRDTARFNIQLPP